MTQPNPHDTLPPSLDPAAGNGGIDPPTNVWGIVRKLGPGLIIAGSIVGSGELIATTKTGAQAGIALLWLIIVGCVIKVFVQIELGRYAITHGETTLAALDRVPGPALALWKGRRGEWVATNWIVWFWVAMMITGVGQLGAIVGGVGQSLALTFPFRGDYAQAIRIPSHGEIERYIRWEEDLVAGGAQLARLSEPHRRRILRGHDILKAQLAELGAPGAAAVEAVRRGQPIPEPYTADDKYWAAIVTALTVGLLFRGRYRLVQNFSAVLVVTFTFITIGNVVSLQMTEQWRISAAEFVQGLSFGLPDGGGRTRSLATALATFGIIGVGASELISYPYWCLEKGYAKFTGPRSADAAWARRARGWMRVMLVDAFASMVIYTVATLAFYLMGVAVLYNEGRDPDGMRMVSTLAAAYVPVFGDYARWLFLIGAIAVLYSTFLVANAGNARMWTDALKIFRLIRRNDEQVHDRTLTVFCVVLPLLSLAMFLTGANPVTLVLIAGAMQATLLPMIGIGALYFRYTRTDERLKPTPVWDACLILSCIGLLITGTWGVYQQLS